MFANEELILLTNTKCFMKTKIIPLMFLFLVFTITVSGQTNTDSLTIVQKKWTEIYLETGILYKQAEFSNLYNVPQNITILEIDPKEYKFDVIVSFPKAETSVAGKTTGASAAINGSYFNVREGYSVCYLRKDKAVIDTTTATEFKQRVTGAIRIKKGKLELLPWNKSTETRYNKKKGTVLASGPLLLNDGTVCDFSISGKGFVETKHPRSAIAIHNEGKILLITVDGRFPGKAEGINIPELAHLIQILGGRDALNLDGGGSSTLWAASAPDNGVLNKLCDNKQYDNKGERKVANSICVYKR